MRRRMLEALRGLVDGGRMEPAERKGAERLEQTIREHLKDTDEPTVRLVTAVAGLLATVAYADHDLSEPERRKVREELARIHGLPQAGAEAVAAVFDEEIARVVSAGYQGWTRNLRDLATREMRQEVLEVLVDLAAADEELSSSEVAYLRRLTTALGLEQADYDVAQARHRDSLTTLD